MPNKAARFRNVENNFYVTDPGAIGGKNLLLIDDILTTGATAAECSRTLRQAGAGKIYVAVLARAHEAFTN
ncbi:ComF family protein [Planctomycetota bacterium]